MNFSIPDGDVTLTTGASKSTVSPIPNSILQEKKDKITIEIRKVPNFFPHILFILLLLPIIK